MVDSSALVMLFAVDSAVQNQALAVRLTQVIPHAPDIVDVEFHHALRGLAHGRKISPERAELARSLYAQMPMERIPSRRLLDRVWSLRHNLGAYDACFLALAEALDVPLITCDEKQRRADGHQAQVEAY